MIEIEKVEKVADRGRILRYIGVVVKRFWVREIVAAAFGQRFQLPVTLDEFQDRNMVRIGVADMPAASKG